MKPTIIIAVILILAVSHLSTYYLGHQTGEAKGLKQLNSILVESNRVVENNLIVINNLKYKVDSLQALQPKIIYKYFTKTQEVDSILTFDTTKGTAINLYRNNLALLEIKPDTSLDLTTKEIGWGAKNFIELQEKRELLFNCYGVVKEQETMLDTLSYSNLALIKKNSILEQQASLKPEPSWWYKRFGFFIGGGYGYDLNTKQVNPQVGVYFGVNIF